MAVSTSSPTISPIPANYNAMLEEYNALVHNKTWSLVSCPAGVNLVFGKWIFRHKLHPDGSLTRYKAHWVFRGFTQQPGVDYGETFSLVVKPATIRVILSIAVSSNWAINQLDIKNAFLHGTLDEVVYSQQPAGFVDNTYLTAVCKLHKAIYGLKQAPRAWFHRFTSFLSTMGFVAWHCDTSLFILRRGPAVAYLLLYVDDIILTASTAPLLASITSALT
uniref:Reverse transcriptase Ty1/copia-type domain-containing protein n=1 Tax=Triticum urartu TaxID=4572 RepID=A0A8R7U1Q0_TRIUA